MADVTFKIQLSNSTGLGKIICFEGLGYDLVVHPALLGEPILTSQAFYYLDNLESVADLRIPLGKTMLRPNQIDYLMDNYLFEYSTLNLDSRLTTKVTEFAFWRDDSDELYHRYDHTKTRTLIVDEPNDPSVQSIEPLEEDNEICLNDWCIPKNYTNEIINDYIKKMHSLLDKKVMLFMMPRGNRDGYMGKKRIFKCGYGLMDLYQAERLEWIGNIKPNDKVLKISSSFSSEYDIYLPIEKVSCENLYNPLLLSFYFSGLNDKNPLNSYVSYYNVLEYYFEEAPQILGLSARFEKDQLEAVIKLLIDESELDDFLNKQTSLYVSELSNPIETSSSVHIRPLLLTNGNKIRKLTTWLYELRCAVVHSKKSRRGQSTAIFEPYSLEAENIKIAFPLIRWLSILCIKKDYELGNGKTDL